MATSRKTAIATPRELTLKQLQSLADSLRSRIGEIEAEALQLAQRATGTSANTATTTAIDTLRLQLTSLTQQFTALSSAVDALTESSAASNPQPTYILIEVDGAEGEPGLTIPGPIGPQGEPGPALFIPGEDGEDGAFYPPP